jgi:hypothetical protein
MVDSKRNAKCRHGNADFVFNQLQDDEFNRRECG